MPKLPEKDLLPSLPPTAFCALIFLSAYALYLSTLNPSLFRNDSPETITACITLGVSHPPGYPLHSLLGRLFSFLNVGNPAFTLNLLSGCLASLGACLFAANLWTLIQILGPSPRPQRLVLLCVYSGSLMFAFSGNYWSCSLTAKGGVYILQMVLDLALLLVVLRMIHRRRSGTPSFGDFYFFSFLFTAGLINHWPTQALLTPALIYLLYKNMDFPKNRTAAKFFLIAATFSILTLSLYLYLPLRSNLFPELNFGAPNNAQRFISSILRLSYARVETLFSAGPQALSTLEGKTAYLFNRLLNEFHFSLWPFFVLGTIVIAKQKQILLFFSILFATTTLINLFYLQALPIEFWHMDDHLLTLNWIFGLIASLGLFRSLQWILARPRGDFSPLLRTVLPAALLAGLPILIYTSHLHRNDQKSQLLYHGYGLSSLKSMERGSLYFAESDYDYFSLLYLTQVEGKRKDIALFLTPFLSKNYEYPVIEETHPELTPNGSAFSGKRLSENIFFERLMTGAFGRPFYCAYSNGPFVEMILRHSKSFFFQPSGILIKCMTFSRPPSTGDLTSPLNDFWEHYLEPENRDPHPINGLFLGICSHPFINSACYLAMRNDYTYWDPFYERALKLIQLKDWLAETWDQKADGNLKMGQKAEAFGAYENAALEHLNAGEIQKGKESLRKAISIIPNNPRLEQILKNLGSIQ